MTAKARPARLHRPADLRTTAISSTGLLFIFIVGIILLATMALLPPMLQNLLGYPTVTTGLVLAPRGVGTMISMILVGRLMTGSTPRI